MGFLSQTGSKPDNSKYDSKWLYNVLMDNKDKPFVQRILYPDKYPTLDYGDGSHATHKMSWGESDGKNYVFPTVVNENGKLIELNPRDAFGRSLKSGGFIEFADPNDAAWFSENYKKYWE